MQRVVIESPFFGNVQRNLRYARACLQDSLSRGEAPFVPHLLYTQVPTESMPNERGLGIRAGYVWCDTAELVALYTDLGMTPSMQLGVQRASQSGQAIEFRSLEAWRPNGSLLANSA